MPTDRPTLLVVTGYPGAGKTTLARRLAADLRLPLFEKDAIKELLYDELEWSDRAWSQWHGWCGQERPASVDGRHFNRES